MTIEDQTRDEKLQYDINHQVILKYHQVRLISMSILLVKKYYHLINSK